VKKICMFLVLCLMATFAYGQDADDSERTLLLRFTAGRDDIDEANITTVITGKIESIESVEGSSVDVGQVNFRTEIRDESGEVVCTIQGHLKDAMAMLMPSFWCPIRLWYWRDFYMVFGVGKVKATSTVAEIDYRLEETVPAPDTGGKYVLAPILMMVSLDGKYTLVEAPDEFLFAGGWGLAGLVTEIVGGMPSKFVGGIAWLTNYLDKQVP